MDVDIKKGGRSVAERRTRLRKALWPDVGEDQLWLRKTQVGFTTIPRVMPLIGLILDQQSGKGHPVMSTYLTLWCWVFDEGLVEIRNSRELAAESGFTGTRAESTWRARMRRLEHLGFIKVRTGMSGDPQHALLLNPIARIKALYADKPSDPLYVALMSRAIQVGSDDFEPK